MTKVRVMKADSFRKLRVFLASPSDVKRERTTLQDVISELNRTVAAECQLFLELVSWDTHCWPGIGADAQAVINRQIAPSDIFIGIYWRRFGTPTKRFASGTEEEFERAYQHWKKHPSAEVLFYFNRQPFYPGSADELAQFGAILDFRSRLKDKGLLFFEYTGSGDFEGKIRQHLTRIVIANAARAEVEKKQPAKRAEPVVKRIEVADFVTFLGTVVSRSPAALIYLDLDGFKKLNDRIGVVGGDGYLKQIVSVISEIVTGRGTLHRISGDEFAVVMPNSTLHEACATGERIRTSIESAGAASLTASLGVAASGARVMQPSAMLDAARRATYVSKKRGRNRLTTFPLTPEDEALFEERFSWSGS